jgi:Putative beta-barrel porin-2, OmpL-like. bbp2
MRRYRNPAAVAVATLLAAASTAALAADPPAPPQSKLDDLLSSAGLTVSGYVAASYYASNGYPFNWHQFDIEHNTFQLDQAGLSIAYQPKEGFGALVDVIAGEDARVLHIAEDGNDNTVDVKQAFLQYATGPLTVYAGKFVTLAGAEVINPTLNTNFSRALLFFEQPLTHTGVRATYAATDEILLTAGVNNGWNLTSMSYGSKTGELGIAWTPASKLFAITAQAYFGKLEALDAEKTLIDVVATYNATSQLSIILNFDYNNQDKAFTDGSSASWHGAALYVNYAITDQWRVSLRGEYLDDKDGFATAGPPQTLKEGTITVGYAPTKNFELRAEVRYDRSAAGTPLFYKTRAAAVDGVPDSDNLSEFALQGVYKFSAPAPAPTP